MNETALGRVYTSATLWHKEKVCVFLTYLLHRGIRHLSVNELSVRPSSGTDVYPHMPILRPHAARFHERRISRVTFTTAHLYDNLMHAAWPIRPILCFWESKVHKMRDSLPWTPTNRRAKCDAASFIISGEIRNRTNKQTNTQTNSKRYIHTLPIGTCG